jgi:hypothetical protein
MDEQFGAWQLKILATLIDWPPRTTATWEAYGVIVPRQSGKQSLRYISWKKP